MTHVDGQTRECRNCSICGKLYWKKHYGWTYASFCSWKCRERFELDLNDDRLENPRKWERKDCARYRQCFDRSAREAARVVCNQQGIACRWCEKFEVSK